MIKILTPLAIVLFVTQPAAAGDATLFDNQADFRAAAGNISTEDLEDEPTIGTPSDGGQTRISTEKLTATSVEPALKILDAPAFGNHNTTPGGAKYLSADMDAGGTAAVTLTFPTPITAFGLYLTDLDSTFDASITINGVSYPIPSHGDGGETFFGIIEQTEFTIVEISGGTDSHWSMDDIDCAEASCPLVGTLNAIGNHVGGLLARTTNRKEWQLDLLADLRSYRDSVMKTSASGRELTRLYYHHGTELTRILKQNPVLGWKAIQVVSRAMPAIRAATESKTAVELNQELFRNGLQLMADVERLASRDLRKSLRSARSLIGQHTVVSKSGVVLNLSESNAPKVVAVD